MMISTVTACSSPVDAAFLGEFVTPIYVTQLGVKRVFGEFTSTTKFYVTSISNTPTALTLNHTVEGN